MNGHGGPRPGSGRKPNEISLERGKKIADAEADAEFAMQLFIDVMRDKRKSVKLRLAAAKEVKDTVWGKPTQRNEIGGIDGKDIIIKVVYADRDTDHATATA